MNKQKQIKYMKNVLISTIILVSCAVNSYLGRGDGSDSMNFTPILVGISALLIFFLTDFPLSIKYIFMNFVIVSNDILIKLFAGGVHDIEGQGWIHAVFFAGLFFSLPFIVIYTFRLKSKKTQSFLYLFLSALFLFAYLFYFETLGLIEFSEPESDITNAKAKRLYISTVTFSENYFVAEKDTFHIKNGWLQAQTRLNHLSLLKKTEKTENNYCLVEINGRFDKYEISNVFYKVNDTTSNGAKPIQSTISFPISKTSKEFEITLFSGNDKFRFFKKIIVKPDIYRNEFK